MEEKRYCSACGGEVPGIARFCLHCGAGLEPPAQPPPSQEGPAIEKSPVSDASVPPPLPLFDLDQGPPPPTNPPLTAGGRIQVLEMTSLPKNHLNDKIPPTPPDAEIGDAWTCPSCGQQMAPTSRFCSACGAKKKEPTPEPPPPIITPPPPPVTAPTPPEPSPPPPAMAPPPPPLETAPPPPAPAAPTSPQCGQGVDTQAKFCRHCGAALPEAAPAPQPRLCPQCRQPVSPTAKFCRLCGGKLEGLPEAGPGPFAPPPPGTAAMPPLSPGLGPAVFAGFWWRALAFILDSILLGLVIGAFSMILFGAFPPDPYQMTRAPGKTGLYYCFAIIDFWLYFALLESSSWQATPGKRALGISVTDEHGRRLTFGRASARTFGKYISGFILGIGFFMAGFTRKKQALHDILARCLVWKKGR